MAVVTIPNPLDKFQSYSVHYILVACRTTVVAKQFADQSESAQSESLQAVNNAKFLGSPVVINGNSGDVFLVLDTRRFAQFSIESLKYDVFVNGLQKNMSTTNLAADLEMVVLDSVGISFANFMQWLMDTQLRTSYDGMVFMLRTIFVGHNEDGSSETVQSETIPMHLQRMEINLDFAKGAYTLEFMPNMNFDVNKYNRFLTISTNSSYATGPGNKLGALVQSVEDRLNDASKKYFADVQAVAQATGSKKQFGRPVQYQITIPSDWESWEVTGSAPGNVAETVFSKTSGVTLTSATGQVKDSYTSVTPGSTIPAVLDAIFMQVPKIAEMGNFKSTDASGDGSIKFYKHIVGLTSSDDSVCVHVDVVQFEVPNLFRRTEANKNAVSKFNQDFYVTTADGKSVPKDYLEFDYIFTGKNKDILNFELKIQDFQFLLASNLRIGDNALRGVSDNNGELNETKIQKSDELLYARDYDPLFLPLDSAAALQNFKKFNSIGKTEAQAQETIRIGQQYTRNLSMFYAGSPITAALTIKGNPLIMHKFNIGKLLDHPASSGSSGATSKAAYRKNLEQDILTSNNGQFVKEGSTFKLQSGFSDKTYATSPVFAKVNIMGPNVDFRTNEPVQDETLPYATSVLSDNYYTIFRVTNNISSGIFTQDLELYSHNVFGPSKIDK